jgi:hypothetical protein
VKATWSLRGELILNCNCEVFCPCVVSLGKHPPTEGCCHGWAGIEIQKGHFEDASLDGLNVGLLLDIPGKLGDGGWTTALYIDERAGEKAVAGLTKIFSGNAGGPPGVLKFLVSNVLGVKQVPIQFEREGKMRRFTVPKIIEGTVEPIQGKRPGEDVVIHNTEYWIGSDVTISRGVKSRLRDFGRVWDLSGRSAEIMQIDWAPKA